MRDNMFYIKARMALKIFRENGPLFLIRSFLSYVNAPYLIGGYLISTFSQLTEKDEALVLLGSWRGYEGNSRHLYEYLLENTELNCVWVAHDHKTYKQLDDEGKPVVQSASIKGVTMLMRAGFVIINHDLSDVSFHPSFVPKHVTSIFISHGARLPISEDLPDTPVTEPDLDYDYYICYSNMHKEFSIWLDGQTGKTDIDEIPDSITDRFIVTGSPKTDLMTNPTERMERNWRNLIEDFNPNKTILYAPVKGSINDIDELNKPIKEFFPFPDFTIEELDKFLAEKNIILLLRPHPTDTVRTRKYAAGPYKLLDQQLNELCKKSERIQMATNNKTSISELLPFVDILLTDWSTTYFEFLSLNRPIIYIDEDCYDNKNKPTYEFDFESYRPGPIVSTQKEFLKEVKDLLSGDDPYADDREVIINEFYKYNDGNATERVAEFLIKKLDEKRRGSPLGSKD